MNISPQNMAPQEVSPRKIFVDERAHEVFHNSLAIIPLWEDENDNHEAPIDEEKNATASFSSRQNSSQTSIIRLVVDEIKQTLADQGVDVGDVFDDPSTWEKLIQDHKEALSATLPAYVSPVDEVVVTRVSPSAQGQSSSSLTVCSDITFPPQAEQKEASPPSPRSKKDVTKPPRSPKLPPSSPRRRKKRPGLSARDRKASLASIRMEEANDPNHLFPGFEEYLDFSSEHVSASAATPSSVASSSGAAGVVGVATGDADSEGSCHIARRRSSLLNFSKDLVSEMTVGSAASNANNSKQPTSSGNGGVRFKYIEIREYQRILCDNPACIGGPPVGIGWRYGRGESFDLEQWEALRGHRRSPNELLLRRGHRERICREWGYTETDIALATRQSRIAQYQRKRTVDNLDARTQRFEEAMESAVRKAKRMFGLEIKLRGQ